MQIRLRGLLLRRKESATRHRVVCVIVFGTIALPSKKTQNREYELA